MSAAIRHIHYKPESEELSIWFGPEGRRYKYFDVPEFLYVALRDAESRGRFFNQAIRGKFESTRVEAAASRSKAPHTWRSAS